MTFHYLRLVLFIVFLISIITITTSLPSSKRKEKFMYDFIRPRDAEILLKNDIPPNMKSENPLGNSPIYYIKMPPMPYTYMPGLGYVSQLSMPNHHSSIVNLPLPFFGNGKPVTIYQWNGGFDGFTKPPSQNPTTPKPFYIEENSEIHRVPGKLTFNGKPNGVFILSDSYDNMYDDALQNMYP